MPTLRLLIPSYNRACQLECLLRSLHDQLTTPEALSICVFYRHSTPEFAAGYEIVRAGYPRIEFVEQRLERSFKQQIQGLIGDCEFFGTIVDDMVVTDSFGVSDGPFEVLRNRKDVFSLSLRLDGAKAYSQPIHTVAMPPEHQDGLVWRWKRKIPQNLRVLRTVDKLFLHSAQGDWSAPWALDGTVYRTDFYRKFFATLEDFSNIPFIEAKLRAAQERGNDLPPNMVRYPRSKSISLAMNSVDEHHDYPSLGLDPKQFNERFLAGGRLDYTPFQKIVFHSCHIMCQPFWLDASTK